MSLKFAIQGTAVIDIRQFAGKLENLSQATSEAADFCERETKLNFERETSPDGAKWAPIAASTLKRKSGGKILRDTSTLIGGIAVTERSTLSARIGATAGSEYGVFHQNGTSKMPARPFIGVSDKMREGVPKIYKRYLKL